MKASAVPRCASVSSSQPNHAHFQRPHSSDPDFELAFNTLHVVKLNALPPASPRRLTPEQKQLLRHTNRVVTHLVAANVAA